MRPEVIVDKPGPLADLLARRMEREAVAALGARGRFALGLTGGSLATTFFPRLSRAGVAWTHTDFFWGDERAVPPSDPESNFASAHALWLRPAAVPAARVHRMVAEGPDLREAAARYEAEMCALLGTPPVLDLALLGVGPDGHVCSLFPGHPLLAERERFVAMLEDAPKPPPRRLTLTLPALAAARLVVVAALGPAKAAVLREALEGEEGTLPVAQVLRRAPRSLVLLDTPPLAPEWAPTRLS